MVVAAPQQPVVAPVQPVEGAVAAPVPKKVKVYCWKCKSKTHAMKDCTVQHYFYVCDNSRHPTSKCPTLKLPSPTTFVSGFGDEDLMFTQFPDSVYKEQSSSHSIPTACVEVHGEAVSAATVETQVARICPATAWKWEALSYGANSFLLGFPSVEDLQWVDGLELGVPRQAAKLILSQWTPEEIPHKMELNQVWVHVTGVPYPLRHFLGMWAVGTLIGTTIDVDLLALRHRGIVRILVGMASANCFKKRDELGLFIKADGVLKLKGYDFTFRPEPADFTPEADFVPLIWNRNDKMTP